MLYIVSGASSSGKTMIAGKILRQYRLPYLSLDWLVMGFTNGLPQYGLHDRLMPAEIAEKLWSFLKPMCESMIWAGADCVIEGEAVLPELIIELMEKHPGKVKVCFLGYVDIDIEKKLQDIRKHTTGEGDWLNKEDDEAIRRHIVNMVKHSQLIQAGCEKYNLRYIETSKDLIAATEEAQAYLMRGIQAVTEEDLPSP